jgi:hypothetical protein
LIFAKDASLRTPRNEGPAPALSPFPKNIFANFPWASELGFLGRFQGLEMQEVPYFIGRGSWIRTNDLQYPKLPRYQAALYPEYSRA